jgi:hypothetical protein
LNDFDDADDYECAIYREGYADCESVYKNICKGKKFRNAEPINKLFPRLPIHVIAIKQEEVWRGLNHFRVAGLVFVLATLAMGIRMLFAIWDNFKVKEMTEVAILTKNDLEQIIHSTVSAAVLQIKPAHFPLIMTKKQVAEYLDKPLSTINRWMTEGLPFRKEGKEHPEFYKPEVDRWLSERFSEPQELRRIAWRRSLERITGVISTGSPSAIPEQQSIRHTRTLVSDVRILGRLIIRTTADEA